jgi:hypothetical protein
MVFLAYFPKVGNLHSVSVSVNPPINFWMAKPVFTKLGMYNKQLFNFNNEIYISTKLEPTITYIYLQLI